MKPLRMLTQADVLAEIRRLYFQTTRQTIQQDFERALDLLKSLATEEEREPATVYMEGLAEMCKDWGRVRNRPGRSAGDRKKLKADR